MVDFVKYIQKCCGTKCRWISMTVNPYPPKQGDIVKIRIRVGKSNDLEKVNYKINELEGTITSVPHTVSINTCKETGKYLTSLSVWGEAIYKDGGIKTVDTVYDLTIGQVSRKDNDLHYAVYFAYDKDLAHLILEIAGRFMSEFHSYSLSQGQWSEPRFLTTDCQDFANSVDMAIFIGHGYYHHYKAGGSNSDWVDISKTAYGSCAQCYSTGDLKYLVFISCLTLSAEDYNGKSYRHYWFHEENTKLERRPFTGLHMVLGFRTLHVVRSYDFLFHHENDSGDFSFRFAFFLDAGFTVIEAWHHAALCQLNFDNGANRTAVLYLKQYQYDRISSNKDDYIYGNVNYNPQESFLP